MAKQHILVILGHPAADSLCAGMAHAYAGSARQAGAEVRAVLTASGARFVTPLSLAALSPFAQLKNLFGQRRKRQARATSTQDRSTPCIPSAKASMEVGDLGSIMVKILES